jgi:hypothetical protein
VRLSWEHIYVSDNGSKYPERPLRSIEKLWCCFDKSHTFVLFCFVLFCFVLFCCSRPLREWSVKLVSDVNSGWSMDGRWMVDGWSIDLWQHNTFSLSDHSLWRSHVVPCNNLDSRLTKISIRLQELAPKRNDWFSHFDSIGSFAISAIEDIQRVATICSLACSCCHSSETS